MPDDLTPRDLSGLVLDKIVALGDAKAEEYFGVSHGTIVAWRNRKTPPSLAAAQRVWDDSPICQTPEVWKWDDAAQIMVGLPVYRFVHPMNHVTMFMNYKRYGMDKMNLVPKIRTLIDEARNDLAHTVLASKAEWLVMADEDMWLPVGNAAILRKHGWQSLPDTLGNVVALQRLMSHPKEYRIIGAMYRDRKTGTKAQCEKGFSSASENARLLSIMAGKSSSGGLEEVGWVGGGLIRIHRSVFEEMRDAAKPDGLLPELTPLPAPRNNEPLGFFGRTNQQRGEDVAFCRRAGKLGIKVYIDTGLYCGHEGAFIF